MIGLLTAAPTHAPGVISFTIEQLWQMILSIAGGITAISAAVVVIVNAIKKAIENAKVAGKSKIVDKNGNIPKSLKLPLRDGDEEREDDPAYEGMYFINASTTRKPSIVDKDLNPIMSQDEFYSGCYGRASINFYAYNVNSKGIAAGLNNLQKLKDGEPLVGGSTAEEDFGGDNAFEDDDLM